MKKYSYILIKDKHSKTAEGFWWSMFIVNQFRYLPNVIMFAFLPSGEAYDCLIGIDGF